MPEAARPWMPSSSEADRTRCRHRLMKAGNKVLLIGSDRAGGVIQSQEAEVPHRARSNSFRGTSTMLDLFEELGLMNDLVTADPTGIRL